MLALKTSYSFIDIAFHILWHDQMLSPLNLGYYYYSYLPDTAYMCMYYLYWVFYRSQINEVYIQDPNGIRIEQWKDVQTTKGRISLPYHCYTCRICVCKVYCWVMFSHIICNDSIRNYVHLHFEPGFRGNFCYSFFCAGVFGWSFGLFCLGTKWKM